MTDHYPNAPGWKARDTSQQAAKAVAPKAANVRELVFASIKAKPGTPDEIAKRLGLKVHTVRPRCSELAGNGRICDSGARGLTDEGRKAIVWKAVEVS